MSQALHLRCAPPGMAASEVRIGLGIATELAQRTGSTKPAQLLVADARVLDLFPGVDLDTEHSYRVEAGEESKSFAVLEALLQHMAELGLERGSRVIALGGGSIGDLVGLACSLYLRGLEFIQVPTTLLSMVDSSVGGKTAINLPQGKNLVGTFWPAKEVWIDPLFLSTLPQPEFRSGLGEVLKIAIGLSRPLLDALDSEGFAAEVEDSERVLTMVEGAIRAKIAVVEADPKEGSSRQLLNLGHTLGHAIEAVSEFSVAHGVAVAQGIHHVLALSHRLGHMSEADMEASVALLNRFDLPPAQSLDWKELTDYLRRDKKMRDGRLNAVLPTGLGESKVVPMSLAEFSAE